MINKKTVLRSAILAATLAPAMGMASGYKINEQSASGVGNAYAGRAAVVEDASIVFYNPAGMVHLKRPEITAGFSYLSGDGKFEGEGTDAAGKYIAPNMDEYSNGGDFLGTAFIPFLYYVNPINESVALGFGIFTPFGTNTDYDADFVGGGFADQTQLKSIEFQPSVSLKLNDQWSVGAGIDIVYMKGLLSKQVDTVPYNPQAAAIYQGLVDQVMQDNPGITEAQASAGVSQSTGLSADTPLFDSQYEGFENHYEVEGNDWGTGFNFGVMWKPTDSTTVGLTYRSEMQFNLEGQSKFKNAFSAYRAGIPMTTDDAGNPTAPAVLDGLNQFGNIREQDSKVPLTTPESATLSIAHQATSDLLLQAGTTWTGWSSFEYFDVIATENQADATAIDISDISAANGLGNGYIGHIVEKWDDVWAVALGASYKLNDQFMLRAGYAYDESPVSNEYRTARVPSSDRQWVTAGFQYNVTSNWTVDMGAAYLFMDKMELSEVNKDLNDEEITDNNGDTKASVSGEYDIDAFGVSLQVSYKM